MKKCCETCWHRDSEPHEEPCISCRYDNDVPSLWKEAEWYEPDTNADRIRAMSDEELAWVLMEFRIDAFGKTQGDEVALPDTQKKICEWLKRPAEED